MTRPAYAVARYDVGSLEVRVRYATWPRGREELCQKLRYDGTLIPETSCETLRSEDSWAKRVDAFGAEKPTIMTLIQSIAVRGVARHSQQSAS